MTSCFTNLAKLLLPSPVGTSRSHVPAGEP